MLSSILVSKSKNLATVVTVMVIAVLSMGNQSCQQAAPAARALRMDVEVGSLAAKPITLPTGETLDFPYVVNSLFYQQVMLNDHFVIENPIPSPTSAKVVGQSLAVRSLSLAATTVQPVVSPQMQVISSLDQSILDKYGFNTAFDGSTGAAHSQATAVPGAVADSALPPCLYNTPQAKLGGEMVSFEASWGVGLGVGYTSAGPSTSTGGLGAKVNFNQSRLQMGLRTDDPLTQNLVAAAPGIASQSKVAFAVSFPVSGIPLGLDFFYNTPLASVIQSAMNQGLSSIVASYEKNLSTTNWNDVWESRVVYDPIISDMDTTIAFRGGLRAGVKQGDTFEITNMHYQWEGDACSSILKYKIPLTTTAVASAHVIQVGDNITVAQIDKYLIDQRIQPGAQVKILKLLEPVVPSAAAPATQTTTTMN